MWTLSDTKMGNSILCDSRTSDNTTVTCGAVTHRASAHWLDHLRCGCLPSPACLQPPASESLLVCTVQGKLEVRDVRALPQELQAVIIGLTQRDPRQRFTVEKALHLLTQQPAGRSFLGR